MSSILHPFASGRRYRIAALLVALLVAATTPAGATAAATQSTDAPSFVVQLQADGDARVTLTLTYDLETDDERAAFRTLQNDSDARADARDRFRSRMAAVASDASDATGREMAVTDAAVDVSTSDDGTVGVVELGVTWMNLAATQDGALVVTEPFASGFEPDRPFTVRGPDGYALASASPSPGSEVERAATWSAGSDLTGFEVVFEPSSDGGGDGADDGSSSDGTSGDGDGGGTGVGAPGFGVGIALLALVGAVIAVARRR